jgi:FMN phosphatase YigB (HAD superfamily)
MMEIGMRKVIAFIISFLGFFPLFSHIIETNQLNDLVHHLEGERVLVIFDLDNTLVEAAHEKGSDQWFSALFGHYVRQGMTEQQAVEKIIPYYFYLHRTLSLQLVEQHIPFFIEELKKQGIMVIALTARSNELVERTFEQLAEVGLDFSGSCFGGAIDVEEACSWCSRRGIIFCGNNNKGRVLMQVLDHLQYKPEKIIFVDDKLKHVQAVQEYAHERGIAFVGIRYNRLDEKVNNFVLRSEYLVPDFYPCV